MGTKAQEPAIRIVAMDDNPGDLELLRYLVGTGKLKSIDFVGKTSVPAALEEIAQGEPDVILVNYLLGENTGIDFLSMVRRAGVQSPAILLTGTGSEEVAVAALQGGFADYLPKSSLSHRSLERAVKNAFEKHRLAQQADRYRKDLEEAVQQLDRQNREISGFYHTLAHELKTPLTGAREYVSLVLDGCLGGVSPEQKEVLGSAIRSCDQLRRCIDDLFDVSRIETGKLQVDLTEGSLGATVRLGTDCFISQAASQGVEFRVEVEDDMPPATFDEHRVVQVIGNLVGNALKFTHRGGRVVVRCNRTGRGYQQVCVQDDGEGISSEVLERVFERLYQAEGNATIKGGMGLGLHLCDQLVKMQGGSIEATSEPGAGSTFCFTIPESEQVGELRRAG